MTKDHPKKRKSKMKTYRSDYHNLVFAEVSLKGINTMVVVVSYAREKYNKKHTIIRRDI